MSSVEEVVRRDIKHLESETVLSIKHVVFNWSVRNFSLHSQYAKQIIKSPQFMIGNVPYLLCLDTPQNSCNPETVVVISLCRVKQDESDQYINYKISLLDDKGNSLVTQEEEGQFKSKDFTKPAGRRMMFWNCMESLHDDVLRIRCEAMFLFQSDTVEDSDRWLSELHGKPDKARLEKLSKSSSSFPSLIISFLIIIVYCMVLNTVLSGDRFHCVKWNKEVVDLVFNSTRQMINIAESYNLTDIKDKASEFLYSYAERHNVSDFDVPLFTIR